MSRFDCTELPVSQVNGYFYYNRPKAGRIQHSLRPVDDLLYIFWYLPAMKYVHYNILLWH